MLIAGITAEYNPFHNGHKYLIEQARKGGATHIAAVMSGSAVQRGDIAIYDKYSRAQTAVANGVDLVLELPCPYSCSCGEIFALSAVRIFAQMGENTVERLVFGSETPDPQIIMQASKASTALKDSKEVKKFLASGKPYPLAVSLAVKEIYGNEIGEVFENPNSILAIEYCKAVEKLAPWIGPYPVARKSVGHNDLTVSNGFASAGTIRKMLKNGDDISEFIPESSQNSAPCFIEKMEKEILYRLSCSDREALTALPDVSGELADRMLASIKQSPESLEEFFNYCKSRNITLARLRRTVLFLTLGVKKEDIQAVPYARILAFNRRGAEILSKCSSSFPIDTSLRRLELTSPHAQRVSRLERNAVSLQNFCGSGSKPFTSEYTRKITVSK